MSCTSWKLLCRKDYNVEPEQFLNQQRAEGDMLGGCSSCSPSVRWLPAAGWLQAEIPTSSHSTGRQCYNASSQWELWGLCVYLTVAMQTTPVSQGQKASSNWTPLSFSPCSISFPGIWARSPSSSQAPSGSEGGGTSGLVHLSHLDSLRCALLELSGNIQHLADLSLYRKSVQSMGMAGAERGDGACKGSFVWERRFLYLLGEGSFTCSRKAVQQPSQIASQIQWHLTLPLGLKHGTGRGCNSFHFISVHFRQTEQKSQARESGKRAWNGAGFVTVQLAWPLVTSINNTQAIPLLPNLWVILKVHVGEKNQGSRKLMQTNFA